MSNFLNLAKQGSTFLLDVLRVAISLRPSKPFVAGITINTICNLRCSYCFIGRDAEHFPDGFSEQGLPGEDIKKILRNIRKDTGFLIITGGEPFLHKDLQEVLRYAKEELCFINISIATNGMFLEKRQACLQYIDRLGISYDLTRESEYSKEMAKMLGAVVKLKGLGILPPVHFTMTILKSQNLDELENFATFCRENNFRIWVQPERDHGDFSDWAWFIETVDSLIKRYGQQTFLNNMKVVREFGKKNAKNLCLPELRVHIKENGKMCYPCFKLEHLCEAGSMLETTPMKAWAEAQKTAGTFPNEQCGNCGFTCYFETAGLYKHPVNFITKALRHLSQ